VTPPDEPRKTVFSFNERGFDFDAVDIGGGDALITIRRGNETVRELKFPAYKVYNIAAHANDIVDGLLEESDRGLQIAGSDGLGGEAMTPLGEERKALESRTREWLDVAIEAVCTQGEDADTVDLVMADAGVHIAALETRIEALEKENRLLRQHIADIGDFAHAALRGEEER